MWGGEREGASSSPVRWLCDLEQANIAESQLLPL